MLASMPLVVGGLGHPSEVASVVPTPQQLTLQWERVGEMGGVGNSCAGSCKGRLQGTVVLPAPKGFPYSRVGVG